mgnify:CR=1 FL=1
MSGTASAGKTNWFVLGKKEHGPAGDLQETETRSRFNGINGEFHIFYDGSSVVACGGVYVSQFNKHIAIAGVRTWTDNNYRHRSLLREYLLPLHKTLACIW